MASVNKVILIGNVTRDPEIKYTPKGTALVELGLAMNRVYTPEGGERREETTFVDVTIWGRTAEIANEYAKKGKQIYIEGRLQMDTWEDKQSGQKRSKLRVVADNLTLLGGGSREGGGGSRSYDDGPPSRPPQRSAPPASRPPAEPEDDDIPF
jgi:single-strand DNA-binding protein